jgi:formylglycine-generating enzyme required for sulfatase activity
VTSPAEQPAKRPRSLTGFYLALGVIIALVMFGLWFWRTWTVWWFDADEAKSRQAAAAARLGLPVEKSVDLGDGVKLELVLIPAGRFRMGSSAKEKNRIENEAQHWVAITRPFYLGKYEVTQEVWEKVMGTNPGYFKGARNPVENVSWDDCQEFLKKLNALTPAPSPSGRGDGVRVRLPTEAEWEWACRAGARFYSGYDEGTLGDYAWFSANSGNTTHPVGTRKPNAWGLYDCHGNVWEWCGDWYGADYYAKSPRYDPTGPVTGTLRVLRGGSWDYDAWDCRSAYRIGHRADYRDGNFGFRVVGSSSGTP